MANPPTSSDNAPGLVGGTYRIDFATGFAGLPHPLAGYAAQNERTGEANLLAIAASRGWPVRSQVLSTLNGGAIANLCTPLAYGPAQHPDGSDGYFVVCPMPQGPSLLATLRPWSEAELIDCLLRPAAAVLAELQRRNVTHRAIRPDNLFQPVQRGPVLLGPAWAAPPACHQPDWLEPTYSACCLPCGRGDGSIADDVYALGATIIMLALGANPFEGMDADAVIRRKLDVGSYAAMLGSHRLPLTITDLVRGMLADDPEHRPSPALLGDPQAARARRIASRPPRRSQRPLDVGGYQASTTRMLAYVLKQQPEQGLAVLRSGLVDRWLRRDIGDAQVALQVDELVKQRDQDAAAGESRADTHLITRAIAVLDPAAPLTWRSVSIWPDGLGPALNQALYHAREMVDPLTEIAARQVTRGWAACRPVRDPAAARLEANERASWAQVSTGENGALRLNYLANPLAPCESPLLQNRWVTRLPELLPALEAVAASSKRGARALVDQHLAAFIVARRDERMDADMSQIAGMLSPADLVSQLRLLARVQARAYRGALPALSLWAVEAVAPLLDTFNSRSRRERLSQALQALSEGGQLAAIVKFMDNEPERSSDEAGLAQAKQRISAIDAALVNIEGLHARRGAQAQHVAQDVAGALGLLACVIASAFAVVQ